MSSGDKHRPNCQDRHDDLAAHALGALEPGESADLEQHLAGCPSCSERLMWLRPAVDLLPASVVQMNSPPELKQSLMAIVHEEAAEAEAEAAPAPAPAPRRAEARSQRDPFLTRIRRVLIGDGPLRPALVGFAAVCLIVAGIAGYQLGGSDTPETGASFAALPASPNVEGHGTVSVEDGRGNLFVEGMDEVGPDEVYQVWVADGKTVEPSSIFVVNESGSGRASIPEIPDGADRVMITREPAGGSESPQGDLVLSAEI